MIGDKIEMKVALVRNDNKAASSIFEAVEDYGTNSLDYNAKIIIATGYFREFLTSKLSVLYNNRLQTIRDLNITFFVDRIINNIGIGIIKDIDIFKTLVINEIYCFILEPKINSCFKDNNDVKKYMEEISNDVKYISETIFNILNRA